MATCRSSVYTHSVRRGSLWRTRICRADTHIGKIRVLAEQNGPLQPKKGRRQILVSRADLGDIFPNQSDPNAPFTQPQHFQFGDVSRR